MEGSEVRSRPSQCHPVQTGLILWLRICFRTFRTWGLARLAAMVTNKIGTAQEYTSSDSINDWGVKIDQVFNDKNRLYGSYIWKSEYVPSGSKYPDPIGEGSYTTNGWRVLRLSEDYFIRTNLVNHWTFGFNRTSNGSLPTAGFGWPATLGYSGVPQTGLGAVFPESGYLRFREHLRTTRCEYFSRQQF